MKQTVVIILIGNITYDGRVQKTIRSLQSLNFDVELICTNIGVNDNTNNYDFKIHILKRKSGGNIVKQIIRSCSFLYRVQVLINKINPDYIHCNDLSAAVYLLGCFKKFRVIYDSHELSLDIQKGLRKIIYTPVEKIVVRKSYKIVLPQIDRLNIFYFRYKNIIDRKKMYLLENFPEKCGQVETTNDFFKRFYGYDSSKKIITYTGVIQKERKLEYIIKSVVNLKNVVLFLIGPSDSIYKEKLKSIILEYNLEERVFLKQPINNKYMLSIAASSDIGICLYGGENLNSYFCASNKIYEYLNSGAKVLTNNLGGTSRIIVHNQNGFLLDEISVENIELAVNKLLTVKSKADKTNYFWESQINIIKQIYS